MAISVRPHRIRGRGRGMQAAPETSGLTQPLRILVRGGDYTLTEPLVLTPEEAARRKHPTTSPARWDGSNPASSAGPM